MGGYYGIGIKKIDQTLTSGTPTRRGLLFWLRFLNIVSVIRDLVVLDRLVGSISSYPEIASVNPIIVSFTALIMIFGKGQLTKYIF